MASKFLKRTVNYFIYIRHFIRHMLKEQFDLTIQGFKWTGRCHQLISLKETSPTRIYKKILKE